VQKDTPQSKPNTIQLCFFKELSGRKKQMINTVSELAPGVKNVLLGGFTEPQIRAVAGEEYRSIYGYDWWRDDQGRVMINDDPDDTYPDGFPMGHYVMSPLGTVNPDWMAAIANALSFKGFTITALLDIKEGGLMWNGTKGCTEILWNTC